MNFILHIWRQKNINIAGDFVTYKIDDIDEDGVATCRTKSDAPEIDGNLFIDEGTERLKVGEIVKVEVDEAGEYDLWGQLAQ